MSFAVVPPPQFFFCYPHTRAKLRVYDISPKVIEITIQLTDIVAKQKETKYSLCPYNTENRTYHLYALCSVLCALESFVVAVRSKKGDTHWTFVIECRVLVLHGHQIFRQMIGSLAAKEPFGFAQKALGSLGDIRRKLYYKVKRLPDGPNNVFFSFVDRLRPY